MYRLDRIEPTSTLDSPSYLGDLPAERRLPNIESKLTYIIELLEFVKFTERLRRIGLAIPKTDDQLDDEMAMRSGPATPYDGTLLP